MSLFSKSRFVTAIGNVNKMICRSTGALGVGVETDVVATNGGKANDEEVLSPEGVADPKGEVEPKIEVDSEAVVDPEGVVLEPPVDDSDVGRVGGIEVVEVDPMAGEVELTDNSVGNGLVNPIVMGSK